MKTTSRRSFRPSVDCLDRRQLLSTMPLTPPQIRTAYSENVNFDFNNRSYAANGSGQTIAIIDPGNDPNMGNDLRVFDSTYGLPNPTLYTATFPGAQTTTGSQSIETELDVEYAHAVAPGAKILLVQAASLSNSDLVAAINYAREQPGVSVISMSFGGPESSADHAYDSTFTTPAGHTGETFVASSGDFGGFTDKARTQVGVQWPADDPNVLSVGGTTLSTTSSGSYVGETAWSGSGGGISQVYAEPSYQRGVQNTGARTVPDVAYDADPNSGVMIYDSLAGGWSDRGGTSAGAPQWAGLIAVADQGRALVGLGPLDGASQTLPALYQFQSDFHDITTGGNGVHNAGRGYDAVTGLGSPIGVKVVNDLAFHVPFIDTNQAQPNIATNLSSRSQAAGQEIGANLNSISVNLPTATLRTVKIPTVRTSPVSRLPMKLLAQKASHSGVANLAKRGTFASDDDLLSGLFDDRD